MRANNAAANLTHDPFQRLSAKLEALLARLETADRHHSSLTSSDFMDVKSGLAELLFSLANDQLYAANVASNSYRHDNGFLNWSSGSPKERWRSSAFTRGGLVLLREAGCRAALTLYGPATSIATRPTSHRSSSLGACGRRRSWKRRG